MLKKRLVKLFASLGIFFMVLGGIEVSAYEGIPDGPPTGAPSSLSGLKEQLARDHAGWLSDYVRKGLNIYNMNGSQYPSKGIIFYGTANDVTGVTGLGNDTKNGMRRFYGITADGYSAFVNEAFPDDAPTAGDTATRRYVNYPWANGNNLTNAFRISEGTFNDVDRVRYMLLGSTGQLLSKSEVNAEIDMWLEGLHDKYAYRQNYWNSMSSNFWRRYGDTTDYFQERFTPQRLRQIAYISSPPTNFTFGQVNTFYSGNSSSGKYYDTYFLTPLEHPTRSSIDFRAISLKERKLNAVTYEIDFTARNVGRGDINDSVPTKFEYRIGNGEWKSVTSVYHDMDWKKGKDKSAYVGQVIVPYDVLPGTRIDLRAEINPVLAETGERYLEEVKVEDNVIKKSFYVEERPICGTGGSGSYDDYGIRVCVSWATNKEGGTYCTRTVCQYSFYTLSNTATVDFKAGKQTLVGSWNRTNDHLLVGEEIPVMHGANVEKDHFRYNFKDGSLNGVNNLESYGISNDLIKSVKELGVDKKDIKKILRAGRALEMYSTIEVELNLSSFTGIGEIENKKDNFMKELVSSLENLGVEIDADAGRVKNANGSEKVRAMLDRDRKKVTYGGRTYNFKDNLEGYMYKKEGSLLTNTYGVTSCKQIKVYRKSYKFVIPVTTQNHGGEQNMEQGEMGKDYQLGDGKKTYYTNINTMNGLHGLAFGLNMNTGALDPRFSGKTYCEGPAEVFMIKGNIYDDIVTEEVGGKDTGWDDDWDF